MNWRALWQALRGLTPQVMSARWRQWHEANDWRGPSERGL